MRKYVVSGVIGFAICLGCILPPLIHLVTGPLGPLIGGFVGGMKAKAKFDGAVIIGLVMGICLGVIVFMVGSLLLKYQISLPEAMDSMISTGTLSYLSVLKIAFIPFAITSILGTIGAFLGGRMINNKAEQAV